MNIFILISLEASKRSKKSSTKANILDTKAGTLEVVTEKLATLLEKKLDENYKHQRKLSQCASSPVAQQCTTVPLVMLCTY